MTADSDAFALACSELVGSVAANSALADTIVAAISEGRLKPNSGPMAISGVLKGAPGSHHLKQFLTTWNSSAAHLDEADASSAVKAALTCYRLAQDRSHFVDTVWTGPEVAGSEVRRTEAVVNEILANANKELLIVGYWLVTSTIQISALIEILIQKVRSGISVRFVFDPGEKSEGLDNFAALDARWPADLEGAPREVYSWAKHMTSATSQSGHKYKRKLHAKVIVADRQDALVTSANLTKAGMLENLEMGLRIQGVMAGAVVRHFNLLIEEGVLERRD